MNNKIDFKIRCKHHPFGENTITVYYAKYEGKWYPLLPNFCDNADGSEECKKCNENIHSQAFNQIPPFAK